MTSYSHINHFPFASFMTQDLHVIVDEPIPGHFYWLIVHLGREGMSNYVVDYARGPLPTRESARQTAREALAGHQRTGSPWTDVPSGSALGWNVDTVPGTLHHDSN
ncbi:hypothetical protein QTI66_09115 [Variovorax sp. J22R133]|uniref:hypothetical protein n=1 Tax=Variovorax brevis TaxID=3053503 RepID=UPI002575B0DD|nr:hypothetical protein [Variovorax sp. J22R133]MDM0112309.1 hypothetical protein [Variovorax sp. J22R133]